MIYYIIDGLMIGWTIGFCTGMYVSYRIVHKAVTTVEDEE